MLRRLEAELQAATLIKHAIWERTARDIQNLRVIQEGSNVVLKGVCRSYYTKQLAQKVAGDMIDPAFQIKNEIEVSWATNTS